MVGIQIGAKPDSGFDDPIGMLMDCHRRIEHFLHILCAVAERAYGRALTAEETSAVQAALQYFRAGGRRHTADELRCHIGAAAAQVIAQERVEHMALQHSYRREPAHPVEIGQPLSTGFHSVS